MATAIGTSWTKLVEYTSTATYSVTYRLYAKYTATSVADNTHTIQMKWTTQKTSGGTGVWDSTTCTPVVSNITGGSSTSWTGSGFTIVQGAAVAETDRTTSGDITITHSSDGTYSATWSWSLSHVYEGGSKSGTVAVTLPTIPRASSFTLSSNSISTAGTTTATITRADSSFTHKITTVYSGTTYYLLGSSSSASTSTSASLSVPTALRTAMKSANAKSATLTLTLTTYSGSTVIGTATTSLTVTAPTATVSMSASSVNCNANITWTLANTDTTACTYTVTRKYSTITYTDQTKGTTTSSAVANANFQTVMSSIASATVTTTVTTYVGTTTVGTSTATYTVKVPTDTYYWSVANGTTTYQGGKQSGKSIAGLEYVTQTFTCTNNGTNNSSTVADNYTVTCSRSDITLTVSKSSNTITVRTGTLPASASNYTFTLTCSIADTRGTTKSVTTSAITATGYQKPKVSGSISRVNSSGTADSTGTYAKVSASATATTATMSSVVITYGSNSVASGTSSASNDAYGGSFSVTSSYNFTVTATDSFGGVTTLTLQLPVASYEFNLYPGGGAAFGTVAKSGYVTTDLPIGHKRSFVTEIVYPGTADTAGYVVFATITINRTYADMPIGFKMARRGTNQIETLWVRTSGGNTTDPTSVTIYSTAVKYTDYYTYKSSTSTWQLITTKSAYNQMTLLDVEQGYYMKDGSVTIDYTTSLLTALPDGAVQAVALAVPLATTATTATSATTATTATTATSATTATTATTATNSTNVAVTTTNPTSITNYYIPFMTGNSGNQALRANKGLYYRTLEGTTSAVGWGILLVGNSTASGTAGNKAGSVRLYAENANYIGLRAAETTSANWIHSLPNKTSGTLALEPVKLYEDATGTTDTVTLSETSANFTYLDIYYYTSHGSSDTPKRMGHTRVYSPNGTQVALTNIVYWSNQLLVSQSQVSISGTSITRLSNEQSQWTLSSGSSPTRSATATNLYIYRVDGIR